MGRALDETRETELVTRYCAGESTPVLAADYGIVPSTAWSILKRHGVQTRSGAGNPRALDQKREAELVARYYAGEGTPTLAASFGIGATTVANILRRHGVQKRRCGKPQLPVWHEAFDELAPDAAYWIGFLFADGHVHQRKQEWAPEVIVALAARDRTHLEKLKTFLRSGHTVGAGFTGAGFPTGRLAVTSHRLGGRLLELGRYEGTIDPQLVASRHFWRGLVDGDGSLGIYRNGRSAILQLVGEYRYLAAFNEFLISQRLAPRSIGHDKSIFQVRAQGSSAEPIVDLLYRDAPTALDRKAVIAQQIMGLTAILNEQRHERHGARVAEAARLAAAGVIRTQAAEALGVHPATLGQWGVKFRDPQVREARIAEAKRLQAAGYMKKEIVEILGVNKTTLQDWGLRFERGGGCRPATDGRLF
jgi:hypothetical protein